MKETIIAVAVIAAAILFSGGVPWAGAQRTGPWQIAAAGPFVWRLNTATGEVVMCTFYGISGDQPRCLITLNP